MSYCKNSIKLRKPSHCLFQQEFQDVSLSQRYNYLTITVIVPVFCACMISAMGITAGLRHVLTMLFEIKTYTEHISSVLVSGFEMQYLNSEEISTIN